MSSLIVKKYFLLFAILCVTFYYLFSCAAPPALSVEAPQLPGLGVLGCGYDATKDYANARSSRLRIFDLGPRDEIIEAPNGKRYSVSNKIKERLELRDINMGRFKSISGKTAEMYRTKLSRNVKVSGSYGLFSGSVTSSFTKEERASFSHEFVTVFHLFDAWTLSLPDYSSLPLVNEAKKDIDGALSPMEVIEKYGTHVLISAVIGGRAEYNCFVDLINFSSKVDSVTIAEAYYKGKLGLSAEGKTQSEQEKVFENSVKKREFKTVGGDFQPQFDPTSFGAWMNSFNQHPVLVDFTEKSLIEIFKLASNKKRREDLKTAFTQYIDASQKLLPDDIPLLEVRVISNQRSVRVSTDRGSGAKMNLSVYKPRTEPGWYWVGQSGNRDDKLIIVKPLVPGAIAPPLGYKRAWGDWGSGKDHGYSLHNIVARSDYRPLGSIARLGTGRTDWKAPSGREVEYLVTIHRSLCTEGMIGGRIWHDGGTGADIDGSIWEIKPKNNEGINAATFYCQNSHSKPPEGVKVYVIKKGKTIIYMED